MTKRILTSICSLGLFLGATVEPARAASIADCGDITVEANAKCEVKTGVACEAECTPLNCSAKLYADCKGQCAVTPPSCDISCSGSCEASCSGNASFECTANCKGTCGASCASKCSAHCSSDANKTECEANCKGSCTATCQGECDASCKGSAELDCKGKCGASCQGSCNASARIDCQASCQAEGYIDCTGGCEAQCTSTGDGGLFCDGQFIDDGGNLQSCLDALQSQLNIKASASGECSGNTCSGEAKASASCALTPGGSNSGSWFGLGLLGVVTAGLVRRRALKRS